MHSPAFLLTFALSLLPSLTGAADILPTAAYATLANPFVLRAQENFNVILRRNEDSNAYVPVISHTKIRLPEFRLKVGNLTTADHSVGAFLGPAPIILPPPLIPLRFSKGTAGHEALFVAVDKTDDSGKKTLRLWGLDGRECTS